MLFYVAFLIDLKTEEKYRTMGQDSKTELRNLTGTDNYETVIVGPTAIASNQTDTSLFEQTVLNSVYNSGSKPGISKLNPGHVLKNRYDLLEKIGIGGMGTVYKALDRRDIEAGNSEFIAIKVLNDEFKFDPELLKALHSEARKTQSLAHPNILTVYDFDRDGPTVFMTMEYIEGATLDKIIKGSPRGLKKQDALIILKQICSALSHAHAKGIIHSDFKPANVFVGTNNRVKVLDFGIARLQNFSRVGSFDAGVLGGVTPAYASLEMLERDSPDPRDDVYALAVVAYELFTGEHPFNRECIDLCIKKHLHPKRIQTLNNVEWKVLKRALSFRRESRIESVDLFMQGLEGKQSSSKKPIYYTISSALLIGLMAVIQDYDFLFFKAPSTHIKSSIAEIKKEIPAHSEPSVPITSIESETTQSPFPSSKVVKPIESQTTTEPLPEEALKLTTPIDVLDLSLNKTRFKIGEHLTVKFTVKKPLYVHIAVVSSLGEVEKIYPNFYQKNNYSLPGTTYLVPPKKSKATLSVSGPVGVDQVAVIASDEPILVKESDFINLEKFSLQNSRAITKILKYSIY